MKKSWQLILVIGSYLIQFDSFSQDAPPLFAVRFYGTQTKLSKQASETVDSIAMTMRRQTDWNYVISSYTVCDPRKSAATWDRVHNIVTGLVDKYGIGAERFIFAYDDDPDDYNEITFRPTRESIDLAAPPHPNLRKKTKEPDCPPNSAGYRK